MMFSSTSVIAGSLRRRRPGCHRACRQCLSSRCSCNVVGLAWRLCALGHQAPNRLLRRATTFQATGEALPDRAEMTLGPLAIAAVAVAVFGSSCISGMFGMAGGMILLGVLLVFMDVAPAMVLSGIIQLASNGWRSALWLRYVDWPIVWRFLAGSTVSFLLMRSLALLPSKATIYLTLGLLPLLADLMPKRVSLDIARPRVAYAAGALIIVLQLLAGAAGHILDVFFQRSPLDRKAIVATKAVTQVLGHVYRILYFGSFAA